MGTFDLNQTWNIKKFVEFRTFAQFASVIFARKDWERSSMLKTNKNIDICRRPGPVAKNIFFTTIFLTSWQKELKLTEES